MFGFNFPPPRMIDPRLALPGREQELLPGGATHEVFGIDVRDEPEGCEVAYVALGCFWGAEKLYWQAEGVVNTAVGYQGGFTPNPTYEEACSGRTGHAEAVKVCFDPARTSYEAMLRLFFENHDPTQGMRQGNDVGTQYRSALYPVGEQQAATARRVRDQYQAAFAEAGFGDITTEIADAAPPFYYAEAYHQQYLVKVPNGYCPIHATGVTCG